MNIRRRRWSLPAALAAAWLLALQSVLGSFAYAAGPDASQFDAFGNVICTHDGAARLPGGDPRQQHTPTCCVLGCNLHSAGLGALPSTASAQAPAVFEAATFIFPVPVRSTADSGYSPANPRAPPTA